MSTRPQHLAKLRLINLLSGLAHSVLPSHVGKPLVELSVQDACRLRLFIDLIVRVTAGQSLLSEETERTVLRRVVAMIDGALIQYQEGGHLNSDDIALIRNRLNCLEFCLTQEEPGST